MGWILYFLSVVLLSGLVGGLHYEYFSLEGYRQTPVPDADRLRRALLWSLIPAIGGMLLAAILITCQGC